MVKVTSLGMFLQLFLSVGLSSAEDDGSSPFLTDATTQCFYLYEHHTNGVFRDVNLEMRNFSGSNIGTEQGGTFQTPLFYRPEVNDPTNLVAGISTGQVYTVDGETYFANWNYFHIADNSWLSARTGRGPTKFASLITGGSGAFLGSEGTLSVRLIDDVQTVFEHEICLIEQNTTNNEGSNTSECTNVTLFEDFSIDNGTVICGVRYGGFYGEGISDTPLYLDDSFQGCPIGRVQSIWNNTDEETYLGTWRISLGSDDILVASSGFIAITIPDVGTVEPHVYSPDDYPNVILGGSGRFAGWEGTLSVKDFFPARDVRQYDLCGDVSPLLVLGEEICITFYDYLPFILQGEQINVTLVDQFGRDQSFSGVNYFSDGVNGEVYENPLFATSDTTGPVIGRVQGEFFYEESGNQEAIFSAQWNFFEHDDDWLVGQVALHLSDGSADAVALAGSGQFKDFQFTSYRTTEISLNGDLYETVFCGQRPRGAQGPIFPQTTEVPTTAPPTAFASTPNSAGPIAAVAPVVSPTQPQATGAPTTATPTGFANTPNAAGPIAVVAPGVSPIQPPAVEQSPSPIPTPTIAGPITASTMPVSTVPVSIPLPTTLPMTTSAAMITPRIGLVSIAMFIMTFIVLF